MDTDDAQRLRARAHLANGSYKPDFHEISAELAQIASDGSNLRPQNTVTGAMGADVIDDDD